MQMMPCPRCGAPNSIKREGCFNCGTALQELPRLQPVEGPGRKDAESRAYKPVVIGLFLGVFALPYALWCLASDTAGRRRYGVRIIIGLGIACAIGLCWATVAAMREPAPVSATSSSSMTVYNAIEAGMTADQVLAACGQPEFSQVMDTAPMDAGGIVIPGSHTEYWYYAGRRVQVVLTDGYVSAKTIY